MLHFSFLAGSVSRKVNIQLSKNEGRVDKQTCIAAVEDVWVENDFSGIFAALIEREKSQSQIITFKRCAEYLK